MSQGPAAVVEGSSEAGSNCLGGSQHRVWYQHQGRSLFKWWVLHSPLPHLVAILHSQLRSRGPEHATHGMQHASFLAGPFAGATMLYSTGPKDRSATDHALLSAINYCKVHHRPQ